MAIGVDTRPKLDISFYNSICGKRYLYAKDLKKASMHLELSLKYSLDVGHSQANFMVYLHLAIACCLLNDTKKAGKYIKQAEREIFFTKGSLTEFNLLIAKAYLLFSKGNEKNGIETLGKAMKIGSTNKFLNCLLWLPEIMSSLCQKALENNIKVEYVRLLIRKRTLTPETPPLHIENWPWPLKVYTMGRFSLLKDDKPVRFSGKTQKKPLELLKALIASGGRSVREEKISDALWPDADGDTAFHAMGTTLYRLRKLIGTDAVHRREGCLSLNPSVFWIDIWTYERVCGEIETIIKEPTKKRKSGNGKEDHADRLAEKTLRLYNGPFLEGDGNSILTMSMRERLLSKFLRTISSLGSYFCGIKKCDQAIACYEKGIEAHTLSEEFYRGLMKCHHCLGEQAKAITIYHKCCNTLSTILGVPPSSETEALFQKIIVHKVQG